MSIVSKGLKKIGGSTLGGVLTAINPYTAIWSGLLGVGGQKYAAPEIDESQIDPDAAAILEQRAQRDSGPATDIAADQNLGTGSASGLLAGGGVGSPMQDALARRQQRQFGSHVNKMRRSDESDAPVSQGARQASTLGAIKKNSVNAINFANKVKIVEQNKKFARNSAINSIIRGGSTLVGTVAGGFLGGTEGAKVGATAGQGFGSAAGQSVGGETGNMSYI